MKDIYHFALRTCVFTIPICALTIGGIIAPSTPRSQQSLMWATSRKDELLKNTTQPRLILIGGSNLSFGIDSEQIKKCLGLNPINTAVHAGIGIKFMLDNSLDYIKAGDIVIVVPEYSHYFRSLDNGSPELLSVALDINKKSIRHLNLNQIRNILPYMPRLALSKIDPRQYRSMATSGPYTVDAFNDYGDTVAHWTLDPVKVEPAPQIKGTFNPEVINYIKKYREILSSKEALFAVSYPSYQASSFDNSVRQINKVSSELANSGVTVMGSTHRYRMADNLMFDTSYHLSKAGVDIRTANVIVDIAEHFNVPVQSECKNLSNSK